MNPSKDFEQINFNPFNNFNDKYQQNIRDPGVNYFNDSNSKNFDSPYVSSMKWTVLGQILQTQKMQILTPIVLLFFH